MSEKTAYIGLGSNLGNRQDRIRRAVEMLAGAEQIELCRVSDLIETAPLAHFDQPRFINGVAEVKTTLSAEDLYKKLFEIETLLGRRRESKWSPRTIDLDIVLFGDQIINQSHLTIPHPQMHLRSFVLKGLCQLNADLVHPLIREPVRELAQRLGGSDFALRPDLAQLVSVAGVIGVGKTTVAESLSSRLGCKLMLEPYDTNPFMADVYAGKKELALDSQLHFLVARNSQLNRRALSPGKITMTDYIFDKDRIYAYRLLNEHQLQLYEQIYHLFAEDVIQPRLVIYLRDSSRNCLARIHERNRPYEQQIELQFLETLDSEYEKLFADWKTCPVIRISMSRFDCARDSDIDHLANQVKYYVAA